MRRSNFFVSPNIAKAETLPPAAFTNDNFLEHELNTIFAKTWQLIPQRSAHELLDDPRSLKEQVARRGAQAPFSLSGKSLFLQRDWKGKLHCFPNVCTHAWHRLIEGSGRERTIVCPQHGRQFDTAGRFLSQPGFSNLEDFPRLEDHLKDLPVEEWGAFLFTCLGTPVAPFGKFLGEMRSSVARLDVDRFKRHPQDIEVREVDGNWKQHAWNYMDRFHITFIHKAPGGLADTIDLASYQTELYPFSALQWAYARDPRLGFDPRVFPKRFRDVSKPGRRVFALWWFIFPNMTFNFYPWGLSVNVYAPVPKRPQRTLFYWYHYVLDEEKYESRNETWLSEQVDREDIDAITQTSRGVESGFAPRGRFAPKEEEGPHWFHRLVYRMAFEK